MPYLKVILIILAVMLGFVSNLQADIAKFKYSYLPKKLYENQLFPTTVLELNSSKTKPKFQFASISNTPIFDTPLVVRNGNDSFYTFYFKVKEGQFELPSLKIEKSGKHFILQGKSIPIVKLKHRDDFAGVLAADMKIRTSQASTYDENNNLVTLLIEAFEANLEDMNIIGIDEDGVENIKRKNAKVVAEYYAVVPASQKEFKFTYFNTIKGQYVYLDTPIVIKDYSVATQSEINPKDDKFDELKKLTFIILSLLFFVMFLWKRDLFYLLFGVLTVVTLMTFYMPKKKICIEQGASLYILPTHTSRISTSIDERYTTHLLGKRADFNKIEYKNSMVGWIKDENICKD